MNNQVIQLSPQQQAVVDWVRVGTGSAFIEAVAGAGKTSTLIKALAETKGSVAFCAYNRKIADEIKAKVAKLNLGNRVRVGTFHSFGLNAWRQVYPQVQAGPEAAKKKVEMTKAAFRSQNVDERYDAFVLKLVSLAKNSAVGLFGDIDDRSVWFQLVEHFDLAYELECDEELDRARNVTVDGGIDFAIRTLKYHRNLAPKIMDFDDMIYMPIVSNIRMWQNDWVFVDEAQDTNRARRAMARKMLRPNGRSAWVGDRHQAIYGFTGADNDAIDQIVNDFGCVLMPLTITYRCPKAVVAEARQIVNHIEAHESAPEGVVSTMTYDEFMLDAFQALTATDAILCRKTKPLVETAYTLIKRGVACHVEGRDIGAGLLKLVNRWKTNDITQLRDRLVEWGQAEATRLIAKGKETQAEALMDRVETVLVLIDAQPPASTVAELRGRIELMFADGEKEIKPTLTLSTVHKAKGREWPRVFILGRTDFMPSPWARQEWSKQQERNLEYVAITRAQNELVSVNGLPVKDPRGG